MAKTMHDLRTSVWHGRSERITRRGSLLAKLSEACRYLAGVYRRRAEDGLTAGRAETAIKTADGERRGANTRATGADGLAC